MKIYASNNWVVGEPYTFNKQHNGLIINNEETDNILKVVASDIYSIYIDDLIIYNKDKAIKNVIGGKTYIAVNLDDVIARIDLEEGEEK